MNRFTIENESSKISFQEYGNITLSQALHQEWWIALTLKRVSLYLWRVIAILEHIDSNVFLRNKYEEIHNYFQRVSLFFGFVKTYHEGRERFIDTNHPTNGIEHLSHILVRIISHGDLSHAHTLLIYQLFQFHSRFCDILNQIEWKTLVPQGLSE